MSCVALRARPRARAPPPPPKPSRRPPPPPSLQGGTFTSFGNGTAVKYITAWSGTAWVALPGLGGAVTALAATTSSLFAAGTFVALGDGAPVNRIAAFNGAQWSNLTSPSGLTNGFGSCNIYALAASGENLYVGGDFTKLADNTPASYIVMWNGTWQTLAANVTSGSEGVNYNVYSLIYNAFDKGLYVGGHLSGFNKKISQYVTSSPALYLAVWRTDTAEWRPIVASGANGVNNPITSLVANGSDLCASAPSCPSPRKLSRRLTPSLSFPPHRPHRPHADAARRRCRLLHGRGHRPSP